MKIKIGTRKSLMALAQANKVINDIKQNNNIKQHDYEIVPISSDGDLNTDSAIQDIGSIGVFSKKIDIALLNKDIDLAIHSLKDISLKRPEGIKTVAITERLNPNDIAIFRQDIIEKLNNNDPITIGTSAPRRANLVPTILKKLLPYSNKIADQDKRIKSVILRGNVNSRIQALKDEKIDCIVLGLGGLNCLYNDNEGIKHLENIFNQFKWMILPISICPTAPGQGSLCVEAREDYNCDIFSFLNHEKSIQCINIEREILERHGGGCHQKFGVTTIPLIHDDPNTLFTIIKGHNKIGQDISKTIYKNVPQIPVKSLWNGAKYKTADYIGNNFKIPDNSKAFFVTHYRALVNNIPKNKYMFTSGIESWLKIAQQGYWVNGCADGFGFDFLRKTLSMPLLQLPPLEEWCILTHNDAAPSWDFGKVISTYRVINTDNMQAVADIVKSDVAWWSSISQYNAMKAYVGNIKLHTCRPGKTQAKLKKLNVGKIHIFPNVQECMKWINKK